MGSSGSFPLDLVLFGMIAAFLVLRLRSILGRRTGFERPPEPQVQPGVPPRVAPEGKVIEGVAERVPPQQPARPLPDSASPPGQALARMGRLDGGFDPGHFLDGAEGAFRIIVAAFAAGDRERLRPLLSDDTFHAFESAIAAREAAGETQHTEIHDVHAATIESADLRGSLADITVRFVTDQVNYTNGSDGRPVTTGTDAVTEITDLWTFERDLKSSDPTWRLVAARSG